MKMTFDPTQLLHQHVLKKDSMSEPSPLQHVPDTTNTTLVSKYGAQWSTAVRGRVTSPHFQIASR